MFPKDVAILAAQVAPVLVVAFIVEVRALAQRRRFAGRDARWLPTFVLGALVLVLVSASLVLVGPDMAFGPIALLWWSLIGLPVLFLIAMVWLAAWAGLEASGQEADDERLRREDVDRLLDGPGWRWFLWGRARSKNSRPRD